MAIPFPQIDPVALAIGPVVIRWYALAYMAGFIGGWYATKAFLRKYASPYLKPEFFDDLLTWVVVGVILGGRFGYIAFYNAGYYLDNPADILKLWHGGMAFHGGLVGVITAMFLFAWKHKIPFFALADRVAVVTPIGLFFGRIANFINGELHGRVTDVAWAVDFPHVEYPRHPSQIYEALTEGLTLFIILVLLQHRQYVRDRIGVLSGTFLAGYALFRFMVEFTREPDAQLGFIGFDVLSMGQLLCIPMFLAGVAIIVYGFQRHKRHVGQA